MVPTGVQIGSGVKAGSVYRITQQGALTQTGNALDLAIDGKGFFQVLMPSGETAYTRAGNFSTSPTGQIVTSDGYVVQPAIAIPQGRHRRWRSRNPTARCRVTHRRPDRALHRRPARSSPTSSTRAACQPSATT